MISYGCQALDHKSNHANPNHRLAVIQADLIVTTKSARLDKPAEGSFHYPALRKNLEALDLVAASHDLQSELAEWTELLNPLNQGSQIAAIGPNELQSSVHAHQEFDQTLGGVAVLRSSGRDHDCQNQSHAVHGHMAFAPRHL